MTYMYGLMTFEKGAYGMIEDAITYLKFDQHSEGLYGTVGGCL